MSDPVGTTRLNGSMQPYGSIMDAMSVALARNWWAVALRGAVGILFGLAALILPFATLQALVLVFAFYMLVDGVFAIMAGLRAAARHERWGLLIFEGVANLLAGIVALLVPGLTVLVFVSLLGLWAVVSGGLMLAAGFRLHAAHGRWLLALSGLLSLAWGVMLYLSPISGALVLTWWLGGYTLLFGVVLLVLALRLRGQHTLPSGARAA